MHCCFDTSLGSLSRASERIRRILVYLPQPPVTERPALARGTRMREYENLREVVLAAIPILVSVFFLVPEHHAIELKAQIIVLLCYPALLVLGPLHRYT